MLLPEHLRLRGALLQHLVEAALRGRGHGVGLGHGGDFLARDGVVGGDFGFGVGAVGGAEGRGGQAQGAAEAERSREHCGRGTKEAVAGAPVGESYGEVVGARGGAKAALCKRDGYWLRVEVS